MMKVKGNAEGLVPLSLVKFTATDFSTVTPELSQRKQENQAQELQFLKKKKSTPLAGNTELKRIRDWISSLQ